MIDGFTTSTKKLRRNYRAAPRWWEVIVDVYSGSPRYKEAQRRHCRFHTLEHEDFRAPIVEWLERNTHKKYRLTRWSVEFQNADDAMLFIWALI